MEHEDSLPCSKEPTIGPYPEPDESSPHFPTIFPQDHSKIIHPTSLGLTTGLSPSGFPTKILYAFLISHACYMPAHPTPLDVITLIIFGEAYKLLNLLIMQFSPASHHFLPLRSKHSPQHPILNLCSSLTVTDRVSHPSNEITA
jgi:hypothetical protein